MFGKGLTKLRLNSAGVLKMLADAGPDVYRRGQAIHNALPTDNGEEWFINNTQSKDRPISIVGTANAAAKRTAAEDMALTRALDAGR